MCFIEWVDAPVAVETALPEPKAKAVKKPAAKKAEAEKAKEAKKGGGGSL